MNLETYLLLPLGAALAVFFMTDRSARLFAMFACAVQLIFGCGLAMEGLSGVTVTTFRLWLPMLGINWSLGIDGANIWLVLLTALMTFLALGTLSRDLEKTALFAGNLLLLNGFLTGLFLSQNLGLFYIFFEAMLLPALLIVAGWSRTQGRETAQRFLMFTLFGSLPMLLGVLILAFPELNMSGAPNLEFEHLRGLGVSQQLYTSIPFFLAFLIKMPLVPFHGWLPPLYRNAPASVVAVIAAMMSKAGAYGMYKVGLTIFPQAFIAYLPYLLALAVISILYGAFSALGTESLREVLAFSSLSHMGMIALGIISNNSIGVAGAGLQMAAHALATGGLFLAVALLERRGMPDELRRYGGLARSAPRLAVLVLALSLAALGQPGLGSFPGELMILMGTYVSFPLVAVVAALGIILAAAYMLRWYQNLFTGEEGTCHCPRDLDSLESGLLLVPLVLSGLMGIAPSIFLQPIQAWLTGVL